jgi:hypothetical protein
MNRITWKVTDWRGRFRAEMFVDGHSVRKAFFATREAAEQWAQDQREEMAQMVRAY